MSSQSIDGYKWADADKNDSHEWLLPALLDELSRLKSKVGASRAFELGCGNGSVASALTELGWDVTGVAPSKPESCTAPWNLGNPVEFTIGELAELVIELTNSRSTLINEPLPADDPQQRQPDISLAKAELDWEPVTPLKEGLLKTKSYFDQMISDDLA